MGSNFRNFIFFLVSINQKYCKYVFKRNNYTKKKRTKKNLDKKFFNIYNKFIFLINIHKHL